MAIQEIHNTVDPKSIELMDELREKHPKVWFQVAAGMPPGVVRGIDTNGRKALYWKNESKVDIDNISQLPDDSDQGELLSVFDKTYHRLQEPPTARVCMPVFRRCLEDRLDQPK